MGGFAATGGSASTSRAFGPTVMTVAPSLTSRVARALAVSILLCAPASGRAAAPAETYGPFLLDNGITLPYPLDNLFRGWVECTGRGHHHALDIGGVGPDAGLGSSVRAMGRAKVIAIGMPKDDPARFGTPLTGVATVERSGKELPASKELPGYGRVWFFTKDYGRHRSGGTISLQFLDGPLEGDEAHYLHLAAARPDLEVGDIVEAGEEIGLLGGTAVLDAPPHLHLSIEQRGGRALDVGNLFGIGSTRVPCRSGADLTAAIRARYSKAAKILMAALRDERARNVLAPEPIATCGTTTVDGDFADGKLLSQRFVLPASDALLPAVVSVERLEGKWWSPRVQIEDAHGNALFTGTLSSPKAKRRVAFESRGSGRRGTASVAITPKKAEELVIKVSAWPVTKRALKGATWRLTIDRPCPP